MGYIEELRELVGHRPLIFVGSVVIVLDDIGRILLQQRKHPYGYWGIPGGLMELGESVEDTARRELLEETGLEAGTFILINVYSGPQNYIKAANGDEFYVVTLAFFTQEVKGQLTMDQTEALTFEYFRPDQLPEDLVGSHRTILNEFVSKFYHQLY
jgi:8-oxo-dGTP pyrophosphatase MutT (NUDIX family)